MVLRQLHALDFVSANTNPLFDVHSVAHALTRLHANQAPNLFDNRIDFIFAGALTPLPHANGTVRPFYKEWHRRCPLVVFVQIKN